MIAGALVDTNVLVYAYGASEADKQKRAFEVLNSLTAANLVVVSTQVLGEFFAVTTRKLPEPFSLAVACERVNRFIKVWRVVDVTSLVVQEAIRGVQMHQLSYWDAQLWAVARLHHLPLILSEDFSNGTVLEDVRFLNPLRPDFRITDWIA